MLLETNYGEIRVVSDSGFVWKIPDFINTVRQNYTLLSPEFFYDQRFWVLRIGKHEKESDVFTCISLQRNSLFDMQPHVVTYKLWIQDFEGEDYWATSVITEEIGGMDFGTRIQKLFKSDLCRDVGTIAPRGVLSLHLTFNPSTVQQQPRQIRTEEQQGVGSVRPGGTKLSSAVGEKNSPKLLSNQSSPPVIDGVDKLVQNLKGLLLSGQKSDVILNVEGKEFKAHKGILVSRSPVFSNMFDHDMMEQSSGVVQITDCSAEVFHIFLLYLYTGKVDKLTVESAIELYCIADKYAVEELPPDCIKFLLRNFSVESFCDILVLGLRYCDDQLLESSYAFFSKNTKKIVVTDKWKAFIHENPDKANELLIKALS